MDRFEKHVSIGMVTLLIALAFLVTFMIKGCQELGEKGLKNIIEEIWEGKDSTS